MISKRKGNQWRKIRPKIINKIVFQNESDASTTRKNISSFIVLLSVAVVALMVVSVISQPLLTTPAIGNKHLASPAISPLQTSSGTYSPISTDGSVAYTLNITSGTLIPGNAVLSDTQVGPNDMTYDPLNGYLYVSDSSSSNVSVIDTQNQNVVATIAVGSNPHGITLDPTNGYLYVMNQGSNSISVINGKNNAVIDTIQSGTQDNLFGPSYAAYDPLNGYLYVSDYNVLELTVYNTTTNTFVKNIVDMISGPEGIYYDGANNEIYIAGSSSNNVTAMNATTDKGVAAINVGSNPVEIVGDHNGLIYVTNENSNDVSVINSKTNSVVATLPVGKNPYGVAYDKYNGYVYVSNPGSDNVSVINGSSVKVTSSFDVGASPRGLAASSSNGYLYVTNYGSGSLSLISLTNYVQPLQTYSIEFSESGLPAGNEWAININGIEAATSQTSLFISEPNGSYTYSTAQTDHSYFSLYPTGSFEVTGSPVRINLQFYNYIGAVNKTLYLTNNTLINGNNAASSLSVYPNSIVYDKSYGTLLINSDGGDSVIAVNTTSDKITGSVGVGQGPSSSVLDPSNGYLYVADQYSGQVSVVNPSSMKLVTNINLSAATDQGGPVAITYSSSLNELFVANSYTNMLQIVNPDTFALIKNITVGGYPYTVAYDDQNNYVYVGNGNTGNVTVVDAVTQKTVANIGAKGDPWSIYYDSQNNYVYVSGLASSVLQAINTTTNKIVENISIGASLNSMILDSSNGILYGSQHSGQSLIAVSPESASEIGTFSTGKDPNYMAFGNNTGTLYLTNDQSSSLSVITIPGKNQLSHDYGVTFSESGLPEGGGWQATLQSTQGTVTAYSSTSTLSFVEPNGTYAVSISSSNSTYNTLYPSSLTIDGAATTAYISFYNHVYSVTFSETGLPTGSRWYLNITGENSLSAYSGFPITLDMPNGTYEYTVATNLNGYTANSNTNSFTVNGAPISQSFTFSKIKYQISFVDYYLPAGIEWYVNITDPNGSSQDLQGSGSLIANEPDGTYSFTVSTANKTYSPQYSSSTFSVSGSSLTETIKFYTVKFNITFKESGLPTDRGLVWYIKITSQNTNTGSVPVTLSTYSDGLANGTYTYSIVAPSGYTANGGNFTVNGSSENITVTFTATGSSAPPPSSHQPTGSNNNIYIIGGVVAVIVVVSGVVLALRRRK